MQFVAVGFSLFGVQWVMHSSVRGYLLSWGGSSVRKKKRLGMLFHYVCFGPYGGREIGIFDNCESLDQTIKNSFLNLSWELGFG